MKLLFYGLYSKNASVMRWHKYSGVQNANKHVHLGLGVDCTARNDGKIHWRSVHFPLLVSPCKPHET